MSTNLDKYTKNWTRATGDLPSGVQHAISDALKLCADGKVRIAYGADVHAGIPCLFNAVSNMTTQQNDTTPTNYAEDVVRAFDSIASIIGVRLGDRPEVAGHTLHPVAAEYLLKNFGDLKPIVISPIPADFAECEGFTIDDENCLNSWVASSIRGLDVDADVVETVFSDGTP
jgi:hypothetical protein